MFVPPPPRPRAHTSRARFADSIKYNIVWQKLLNYTGPFPWKDVVAETEVPYYLSHANAYGPPMDSRHTCEALSLARWPRTTRAASSPLAVLT